jgi:hypothetical protein
VTSSAVDILNILSMQDRPGVSKNPIPLSVRLRSDDVLELFVLQHGNQGFLREKEGRGSA